MVEPRIGVYVCHCGSNIAGTVDVEDVAQFAETLNSVIISRAYKFMCSDPGQNLIKDDIRELNLNRIVVASCSPTMHESTFRKACQETGLNPYLFEMANIREHCSWVTEDHTKATEKAKALVAAAVNRVFFHEPLETRTVTINPDTIVVGAGIAGITAALEIADSGHQVYLIEREPSIGGHMSQLDKTFPTLDCSACILTPRMTQVGHHPNIELMTYSEVEKVSGYIGNFSVTVRRKARFVDLNKCTGCGECEKNCPVTIPSEYELGLTDRRAIYRPFPQAVPNAFTIEKRGYPPCRVNCPAGVNAQGYIALISQGKFNEALDLFRLTQPFAGICGRVCTHPCETSCVRGKYDEPIAIRALKRFMADYELNRKPKQISPITKTKDESVAIIGSGPSGLSCAYDLVRQGYSVTVFESDSEVGGMLRYGIPEYRLPRQILDAEIDYIQGLGVEIQTNHKVNDLTTINDQGYKAIYLATGAWDNQRMGIPNEDIEGMLDAISFLKRVNSKEKITLGRKLAVIGGGNAAVDAARVAYRLGVQEVTIIYRRSRDEMPAVPSEIEEAEREGIQLRLLAAPTEILSLEGKVSGLQCIKMKLGEPDASGRRRPIPIEGSEFTIDVDNVIMAIGQRVKQEDLPPKLNYTPRGTLEVDPVTLQTSIEGVFAGGDVVSGPADVIHAIAAGKEAAISIQRYLEGTNLHDNRPYKPAQIEPQRQDDFITEIRQPMPTLEVEDRHNFQEVELGLDEQMAVKEANRCLNCGVCSECLQCIEACEVKAIDHQEMDEIIELNVGNIILATGFDLFTPSGAYQHGYQRYDNVYTSLEFERLINASGPTSGEVLLSDNTHPNTVAIIHCVGSRDKDYHEYCSRVCCMYSLKLGHLVREHVPGAEVYEFYRDMRSFGKGFEEFYNRIKQEGTKFIRAQPSHVTQENGNLIIHYEDRGLPQQQSVDMIILSVALEAQPDAESVARLFNISRSADGFFLERHPKLDPVTTMTDGIYVAGCCQSPKDIPDTVAQASATAAEVLALIGKGIVDIEAVTANINQRVCNGCLLCLHICPYSAISFDDEQNVCHVNEALCKGCGTCASGCPSHAINLSHYTNEQILAEMEGLLIS